MAQFFHVGLPPGRGPVSSHFNARKQIRALIQPTRWGGVAWKGLEQKLAAGPKRRKSCAWPRGGRPGRPHSRFFEPKNARLGHKLGRAYPCAPLKTCPATRAQDQAPSRPTRAKAWPGAAHSTPLKAPQSRLFSPLATAMQVAVSRPAPAPADPRLLRIFSQFDDDGDGKLGTVSWGVQSCFRGGHGSASCRCSFFVVVRLPLSTPSLSIQPELAAFIQAVNPGMRFTTIQMSAVLEEV